ncbi:SDR family NAD(P)-dependent oxidoreductase [Mycolicibacterium litorale]|uniref:Short-chain dehydrogenase n=1 Tax=Mycolicibacterium litorale TaxID=758802 RepID=A0AAD1IMP8_9MYCO|nr:SDR family NAD(P)-dependent oxidoreductase [Mycolicibacterium litorale]MCV7417063.1 SDR family NAD(P)-dependent oxidoreductase [Mycolicibacterium litorale]TDY04850.1 NAD(P)-dependent dehydrogenase (short-subunit alcohol dehydrogenase family) [Mycolicibacterium litorale]BBY18279.1 short-chain dehydrogenase [Mycolicibacterium litorale]
MTEQIDAPVAVVTGASRGAGRGIARALISAGWRVYLTGRTVDGLGEGSVAVPLDHRDDAAVAALFARVEGETGRLDLLVNNAAAVHDALTRPEPFWDKPLELGDVLDVGLRSAYVASWHAAPLLLRGPRGLIVFTSSPGSVCYMHGPAYGAQKAGVDKMAADMAVDFRDTPVHTVSIWMGILLTEKMRSAFDGNPEGLTAMAEHAETPEFTGRVIDALYRDPAREALSGHTVIGAEMAVRYGITDEGGRQPGSHRDMLGAPRTPSDVVVR